MVAEIGTIFSHVDLLIEIANLCSPPSIRSGDATEADKHSILVIACPGPPIRVVEMKEDFIPCDPQEIRVAGHRPLRPKELAKPPTDLGPSRDKPLLQPTPELERCVTIALVQNPLLPDSVLMKIKPRQTLSNPGIPEPDGLLLIQLAAHTGADVAYVLEGLARFTQAS